MLLSDNSGSPVFSEDAVIARLTVPASENFGTFLKIRLQRENMKKVRNLLLCAALLFAAVAICFALTRGQKQSGKKELLIDLTADKIAGISWIDDDGETLSFIREDGKWICKTDPSAVLDQTEMNTLCAGMTGIAVFQTMEDVKDLTQYGLNPPAVTITVKDLSGNEITVALGDTNDSAGVLYAVRDGDEGTVYAVTPSIETSVQKKLEDLMEKDESKDDAKK